MKAFLVFVAPAGILMAISPFFGGNERDPTEMLAKGVELARICPHVTEKIEWDEHGREKEADSGKDRDETASKLSLSVLFKPGRFRLENGENLTVPDGRTVSVIRFGPRPEKEHLKTGPGEDKRFNWGMNRMSGYVHIDDATGGIVRIEGKTPGNQVFKKFIKLAELKTLEFTLEQKLVGDTWLPQESVITLHVEKTLMVDLRGRYITRYYCQ